MNGKALTVILYWVMLIVLSIVQGVHAQKAAPYLFRFGEDREGAYGGPDSDPQVAHVIDDGHMTLLLRDGRTRRQVMMVVWRGPTKGYYDGKRFNWSDMLGGFDKMIRCAGTIRLRTTDGSRRTYLLYERWQPPAKGK